MPALVKKKKKRLGPVKENRGICISYQDVYFLQSVYISQGVYDGRRKSLVEKAPNYHDDGFYYYSTLPQVVRPKRPAKKSDGSLAPS